MGPEAAPRRRHRQVRSRRGGGHGLRPGCRSGHPGRGSRPRAGSDSALGHLLGHVDLPAEIAGRTAARLRHVDQLTAARRRCSGSCGTTRSSRSPGRPARARRGWRSSRPDAGRRPASGSASSPTGAASPRWCARRWPTSPSGRPAFSGTFHQLGYDWGVTAGRRRRPEFWERNGPGSSWSRQRASLDRRAALQRVRRRRGAGLRRLVVAGPAVGRRPGPLRLAVFRDDEQAVFSERRGRPDLPLVPLVLDENLRNAQQIVDAFRPLITSTVLARAGERLPRRVRRLRPPKTSSRARTTPSRPSSQHRGWLPEHVALLTTQHRHPVHVERSADKDGYWQDLWADR